MDLFNKYKNKDFIAITNYINNCINDSSLAFTPDELSSLLRGTTQNTFEELIQALLNKNSNGLDSKSPNVDLFYINDEDKLLPIRENYIPIRPSIAEKAWLLYILKDPKASLFIKKEKIKKLIQILSKETNLPIIEDCVDIRNLSNSAAKPEYTAETIETFKCIVSAICQHKELIVTNTAFDGQIFENQTVLPYKLEYSPQFDSFSLSASPVDTNRPVKMNLLNLKDVRLGNEIQNYDSFIKNFETQLTEIRVKEPITIEITNDKNGYDRCCYKFASFDRVCYENKNGDLTMNIYYYRFQKDEILRNIMFLGPSIKIISPDAIKKEYITLLQNALKKYEAED